ncbi:hypothetical protein SEPCBS57363_005630 [Sporothrix epigloea]|uniref:SWR1-complex protein 3 domain-containing protein n=1 Tax=Sporothrix epigloea TaxID=1892477 RepID=A0ABP0DYL6_9PEZI
MEQRKRKIPPRAAARAEQAAKRRLSLPPVGKPPTRSTLVVNITAADENQKPTPEESPAPKKSTQRSRLPLFINANKPLPSIETAQSEDLSNAEYQTVQESGVLAESLSRSRLKWINEGIFEKYWSKPSKRRGVATDDPKNPSKDSMVKLGQVLITVEPHVFEATMYGVRDPKPAPMLPPNRPVLMYGPSGGAMPPPGATPPPKQKKPRQQKQYSQSPAPRVPMHAVSPSPATPDHKATLMATPTSSSQPLLQPLQPQQDFQTLPAQQLQPPQPMPTAPVTPQQFQLPSPAPTVTPVPLPPTASVRPPAFAPQAPLPSQFAPPPTGSVRAEFQSSIPASSSVLRPPVVSHRPPPLTANLQRIGQPCPSWPAQQATVPGTVGTQARPPSTPISGAPGLQPNRPLSGPPTPAVRPTTASPAPGASRNPAPAAPAAPAPPGNDSVIVTLAERASHDAELREMMKRVARTEASKEELDAFQSIINQITEENKNKGTLDGPSADRLFVSGRTVRFFAQEVNIILDIVLRSNPEQKSFNLVPPEGSDQLVVLLVKKCLDDMRVRDMVRRIADNVARYSDATDLKDELEKLRAHIETQRQSDKVPLTIATPVKSVTMTEGLIEKPPKVHGNGVVKDVHASVPATPGVMSLDHSPTPPGSNLGTERVQNVPVQEPLARESIPALQTLRSKAPLPAAKLLDLSAVVFEFSGGTGDRYMFPKFSIVECVAMPQGPPEAIASFLIVRKGSASEYSGDPHLDYYQPITVRLQVSPLSNSLKLLEYLSKVVAPVSEVRRYMEDTMNSMTRAEFVLLAMRLPRRKGSVVGGGGAKGKAGGLQRTNNDDDSDNDTTGKRGVMDDTLDAGRKTVTPGVNGDATDENEHYVLSHPEPVQGVLWATKAARTTPVHSCAGTQPRFTRHAVMDEDDQYQSFIAGLIPKEVEEEA